MGIRHIEAQQGDALRTSPDVPVRGPLLVQAVAYIVLVAVACIPGSERVAGGVYSLILFAVGLFIMLFALFAPLRDGVPGRITACVVGFLSMICAATPFLGELVFNVRPTVLEATDYLSVAAWLAGVAVLLVALVVVSFARQMARNPRPDMIVQMSHMVMDGAACIAASGWCFLPMLFHAHGVGTAVRVAAVAAVATVAVLLGMMSCMWLRDARPLDDARSPWIGMGLLPVMLTGGAVGIAVLVMLLV